MRFLRSGHFEATSALLAMVAGGVLWIDGVRRLQIADLDDLGIFRAVSPTAYLGLSLIVGAYAFTLRQNTAVPTPYRYAQVSVLLVALYGVTPLFEPVLGFRISYRHAGVIDYISTTSSVDPNIDAYFNWPGFFSFGAFLNDVAGIDNATQLAHWAPLFYNALYVIPVVMIMRVAATSERQVWAGVLVFFLGNWVGQDYFSPQATAYFLYLMIMALVLRWLTVTRHGAHHDLVEAPVADQVDADDHHPATAAAMLLVVIVMFAAIVPSHQLTPFAIVLGMSALVVTRYGLAIRLPIIMVAILSGWMAFRASAYLSGNLSDLLNQVGRVQTIFEQNVNSRIAGSADHQAVVRIRLLLSALLACLAALGYLWSNRRPVDTNMALLCASPVALLALQNYGGEVLLRAYLFSLPFAAYFAASLLIRTTSQQRTPMRIAATCFVVALVAFSTTAFLIARYGNQRIDSFTADEVAGVAELYELAPPGSLLLAGVEVLPWKYQEYDTYDYRAIDDLDGVRVGERTPLAASLAAFDVADDAFVIFSRAQFAYEHAFGSLPDASLGSVERNLVASGRLSLVFTNSDTRIYEVDAEAGQ